MLDIKDIPNGALIFTKDNNLLSNIIQNEERDFDRSHVASLWWVRGKPWIYTTGAHFDILKMGFTYGAVEAEPWLAKHDWIAGIRTDLTTPQQLLRFAVLRNFVDNKTPYAINKVLRLSLKGHFGHGYITRLNSPLEWGVQPKVFCSESEAIGILLAKAPFVGKVTALATINSKYPNKLEACTHTPETLYMAPETQILTR